MVKKRDKPPIEKPVKPELKTKPVKTVNPSEKLAVLLRKESMLAVKAQKAREELNKVQTEIRACWNERERLNQALLNENLEV